MNLPLKFASTVVPAQVPEPFRAKRSSLKQNIAIVALSLVFDAAVLSAGEKAPPPSPELRAVVSALEDDFIAQLARAGEAERVFDEYEAGIRKLIAENPGRAEPYLGLAELFEKCPADRSLRLIDEMLGGADLPENVRTFYGQIRGVLSLAGTKIDVSLTTLEGKEIDWPSYRGKVVLLDFWATWCGPCVQELPKVKGYYSELHPRGLEIVGVSFDDDRAKLENFVRTRELPWAQVHALAAQRETVAQALRVTRGYLPTVFLIGRDGRIRYSFNARFGMKEKILSLLSESSRDDAK